VVFLGSHWVCQLPRAYGDVDEKRTWCIDLEHLIDGRGGGGPAGAPLPRHRHQGRELLAEGSCDKGSQESRHIANVIDAGTMAATINGTTAAVKGGM
jgi:hypothetical protein